MALDEGGILLIEPHAFSSLKKMGKAEPSWYSAKKGLFSDTPHLCLQENCWNDENKTLTKRWYIVDTRSADVRYVAQCYQAHTKAHLQSLLKKRGFKTIRFYTALSEEMDIADSDYMVVSAEKCRMTV